MVNGRPVSTKVLNSVVEQFMTNNNRKLPAAGTDLDETIYLNKPVYYYRRGDVFASSYNHKSLHYVLYEYEHLESFLDSLSEGWKYIYYCKDCKKDICEKNVLKKYHLI